MQLAEVACRLDRGDRHPLVAVMDDLDGAAAALAELADMRLRQAGMAAVDVADDVGIGLQHGVPVDQPAAGDGGAAGMDGALDAVFARPGDHLRAPRSRIFTEPRPTSPSKVTPAAANSAKSLSTMPCSSTGAPASTFTPAGRALKKARWAVIGQGLQANDVLRPAGQVHLAGRDHRGDAAVQEALDPADLVLPRRPVAEDRVDMAVHQAGRDGAAMRVDHAVGRAAPGQFGGAADAGDPAILDQDRIGIEQRRGEVAREQQADIPHQGPALRGSRRLLHRHRPNPLLRGGGA